MKGITLIIICILLGIFISSASADEVLRYYIKFKNRDKPAIYRVQKITKESVTVFDDIKGAIEFSIDQIEYMDVVSEADRRFKKVIILFSNDFYEGHILYQDRKTITIKQGREFVNLSVNDVRDIVSAEDFNYEMSKTKNFALLYSAIYPGMGQLYTYNRRLPAILFMSGFTLTLFAAVYSYFQSNNYYNRYESSKFSDGDLYDKHRLYRNLSVIAAISAVGIYTWNLLDVHMNFQYKYDVKMNSKDLRLSFLHRY